MEVTKGPLGETHVIDLSEAVEASLDELAEEIITNLEEAIKKAKASGLNSYTLSLVVPEHLSGKIGRIISEVDHYFQTTEGYYLQTDRAFVKLTEGMIANQVTFFWDDGKRYLEERSEKLGKPVLSLLGGYAIRVQ